VGGLLLQLVILFDRATARYRENPPVLFGRRLLFLARFEPDRH
jgi:hypothetical protein